MERIRLQDEAAFEIFISRFTPMLRTVVARVLPNNQDVSDVLEEVFLGIWKQASNFDPEKGKAASWTVTMACRRAMDRVRHRGVRARAEIRLWNSIAETKPNAAATEPQTSDAAALFGKLISALPASQKEVIHKVFYHGSTQREIAQETGIPLGTVRTRLELGIKKLRTALESMGSRRDWFSQCL